MDEINKTIKEALAFVHAIQRHCDQHRLMLEEHFLKELNSCPNQPVSRTPDEDEHLPIETVVEVIEEKVEDIELEEIKLADKLLEKARRIRQKHKMPDLDNVSSTVDKNLFQMKQSASVTCDISKTETASPTTVYKVRQSKSAPVVSESQAISPTKKCGSRIPQCVKSAKTSKSSSSFIRSRNCAKSAHIQKSNVRTHLPVTVSKKELNMYRGLHLHDSENSAKDAKHHVKESEHFVNNCHVPNKEHEQNSKAHSDQNVTGGNKPRKTSDVKSRHSSKSVSPKPPWVTDFQPAVHFHDTGHGRENIKMSFCGRIWYPYVNPKNESLLTLRIMCRSKQELRQACALLHKIQEALLWLDLLSLVGKQIAVQFDHVDKTNQKDVLICSYVQSLFHERLQRTPMVVQH